MTTDEISITFPRLDKVEWSRTSRGRFKRIIGEKLRSRTLESQKNEAKIGCKILNIMVRLGTPLHPATQMS